MRLKYISALVLAASLATACNDGYQVNSLKEDGYTISTENRLIYCSLVDGTFIGDGGEKTLYIYSGGQWEIESLPEWLSASSEDGSGSAEITITAAPNNSSVARTAIFLVRRTDLSHNFSYPLAISQAGTSPYFSFVDHKEYSHISIPGQAAVYELEMNTNIPVSDLLVKSTSSWAVCAIEGNKVKITVEGNPLANQRQALIYVNNKSTGKVLAHIYFDQAPATVIGNIDVLSFSNKGGMQEFTFSSEMAWTADTDASWLQITPAAGGSSDACTVSVTVLPNNSTGERSGVVYIRCDGVPRFSVQIKQDGSYIEGTNRLDFPDNAGTRKTTLRSNVPWKLVEKPDWLKVSPAQGTEGNTEVSITVDANNDLTERRGYIYFTDTPTASMRKSIYITQTGITTGDGSTIDFSWKESSKKFRVRYPGQWQIAISDPWIEVTPMQGSGNSEITVRVSKNEADDGRRGSFTIRSQQRAATVNVVQTGQFITLSAIEANVPAEGGNPLEVSVSTSMNVQARMDYAEGVAAWNSIASIGNNTWKIYPWYNPSLEARTCWFVAAATDTEASEQWRNGVKMKITQNGRRLAVNTKTIDFVSAGGTSPTFTITADGKYSVEKSDDSWFILDWNEQAKIFSVYVTTNNSDATRTGAVILHLLNLPDGQTKELSIPVRQIGSGAIIDIEDFNDPTKW